MIRRLSRPFVTFFKNEEGVTAVECALLLALVVAICLVALGPVPVPEAGTPQATLVLESDAG
jgi:hypothetical protein